MHPNSYTIRSRATDTAGNEEHTDSITFTYNTITGSEGSIYVSDPSYRTNADYNIYYPTSTPILVNSYMVVDFADEYRFSPWIADSDVTLSDTGTGITASSDSFDRANKTITSTVTAGSVASGSIVLMEIDNLRIHNPSATGSYVINIKFYNSSHALIDSGSGIVVLNAPYQQVQLNAQVDQSLQIAVDSGAVALQVDPDVQLGQNWTGTSGLVTEKSAVEVKTNANNGYSLMIKLAGNTATGSAVLDGSGTSANQITSSTGNRVTTENNFAFKLTNSGSSTVDNFTNSSTTISGAGLSSPTNANTDNVYYYLNVDYTTPSDDYKGTVTYTAVGSF